MTKPTIRELLDDIEDLKSAYELAERVEAVLKLHRRAEMFSYPTCNACKWDWPCPTIRALDGEQP